MPENNTKSDQHKWNVILAHHGLKAVKPGCHTQREAKDRKRFKRSGNTRHIK